MKMFSSRFRSTASLIGALTLASITASAHERALPPDRVPRSVQAAIARTYPQAKIVSYALEKEDGVVSYEATLRMAGRTSDIEVSPEGRILVQEDRIGQKELPQGVSRALSASEYGRGRLERVERITEPAKGTGVRFEIVVRTGDRRVELTFEGDGRLVKTERIQGRH